MNDELSPGGSSDMSDAGAETDAQRAPGAAPAADHGPPTAGSLIRRARQDQGLDLASLAAMLKVPLKKLEALEQGRHEELPGQTFERALAQAACRVLKIDPKPVLDLMPRMGNNTLEHVGGGINTPFREQRAHGESVEPAVYTRPGVILPVVLVVGALVLLYAPASLWNAFPRLGLGSGTDTGTGAEAPASEASGGVSTSTIALPVASQSGPATPVIAVPSSGEAVTSSPSAATTAPAAPASPAAVPAAPAALAAAPAAEEVPSRVEAAPAIAVQVTAAEDSWIEVVDAQGRTLLSRTVVAGESVGLDGALPMKVKVGNARGTRLTLRGENVDLAPWTRDNIARLTLK
jgi:cytoskeleton protein RodZ